jgi:hypothetical protein
MKALHDAEHSDEVSFLGPIESFAEIGCLGDHQA